MRKNEKYMNLKKQFLSVCLSVFVCLSLSLQIIFLEYTFVLPWNLGNRGKKGRFGTFCRLALPGIHGKYVLHRASTHAQRKSNKQRNVIKNNSKNLIHVFFFGISNMNKFTGIEVSPTDNIDAQTRRITLILKKSCT